MTSRRLRRWAFGITLVTAAAAPVVAWSDGDAIVRVPPGGRLRATLGNAKTEVSVERRPKLIDVRFGRLESGRFVAYAPSAPMPYDRPFLIRVQYDAPPAYDQTVVTLDTSGGRHEVPVYKLPTTPAMFQSRPISFEDPSGCLGLRFCVRE